MSREKKDRSQQHRSRESPSPATGNLAALTGLNLEHDGIVGDEDKKPLKMLLKLSP